MSNAACVIFGLKEEASPKGAGYLYLSFSSRTDGKELAYFDLYKTSSEKFRDILNAVLPKILSEIHTGKIELVNFKPFSAEIFREVAAKYTNTEIIFSESGIVKMHF
jgi:hypothetical protein